MTFYTSALLPDQCEAYFRDLEATGLYGDRVAEALILEGLQRAAARGILKLPEREVVDPEATPAAAVGETYEGGIRRTQWKCEHCHDGMKAEVDGQIDKCPHCGAELEIPF